MIKPFIFVIVAVIITDVNPEIGLANEIIGVV